MRWNRPASPGIDAEMMELHLRLRPRQRGRPLEGGGIAMLVDEVEHRLAGCGNHRPEGDAHGGAGRDAHTAAQCEDRIEHRADGVGQRPTIGHRDRRMDAVAAAEEAGPIGFHLRLPHRLAIHDGQMRRPDLLLSRRAPPPRCQQSALGGEIFGGDEQLHEGGMRDVVGLRRQHQFGIGCHVDLAHPVA